MNSIPLAARMRKGLQEARRKNTAIEMQQDVAFHNNSVSAEQLDFILHTIQGLREDLPVRRLIMSLPKLPKDSDGIIVGCNHLARCNGVRTRDSNGLQLLNRCRSKYDPAFEWKACSIAGRKCRVITKTSLTETYRRILLQDKERWYVESLSPVTRRTLQETERSMRRAVEQIEVPKALELQVGYLLKRKLAVYADAAEENNDAVIRAILRSKDPQAQLVTWDKARMMPKPFPFLSQKEGSLGTRIYHKWISSLCSEARNAWLPFAITLDMKNCQLAILGGMLGIRSAQDFLVKDESFWEEITRYMGVSMACKWIVKQTTYSLCYGMGWTRLHDELRAGLGQERAKRSYFGHPIIKETLRAVRKAQEGIVEQGGMEGAYGWIPLGNRQPNTVLAYAAQSVETDIIRSIYEVAAAKEDSRHATFQILGHIHDGLMIQVYKDEDQDRVIDLCKKVVAARGNRYNAIARLEVEEKRDLGLEREKLQDLDLDF